jgi:PAS domain S-box-containing protein
MNNYNYKSVLLYTLAGLILGCMLVFNSYMLNVQHGFNEPWFHIFDYSPDFIIITALPIVFSLLFCFIGIRWQQLLAFNLKIKENLVYEQVLGTMADRHLRMLGKVVAEMNEAVMIIDNTGCILWGNESFCETTGYALKDAVGEKAGTILTGNGGNDSLMNSIKLSLLNKGNLIEERVHYRKDGGRYWAMINVKPIFNDRNKISNYVIIQTDITARKEREMALENETLNGYEYPQKTGAIQPATEMAKTGRWEMDMASNQIFLTQELRKIYNMPLSGEITREDLFSRIYPDDVNMVERAISSALAGERSEFEYRFLTGSGMLYLVSKLRPKMNNDNIIDGCTGRVFDITQSKKTELALAKSEIERAAVFNNAQTLICLHDTEGVILDINKAAVDQIGYSKEELIGKNMRSFLLKQYQHKFDEYLHELAKNKTAQGTFLLMSKTGKKMAWLYQNTLCDNNDSKPYIIATSIDITESLKAKNEIEKQQEFINQIIDNSPNVIFVVDDQQQVVLYNKEFNQHYNCSDKQIPKVAELAKMPDDIFLGGFNTLLEMRDGQTVVLEGSTSGNNCKEGASDWYSIIKKCFKDKRGKKYILVIGMDITGRYQVEKDLIAANEMVERSLKIKDQFISNMSHEIRTPLNAVMGFTDLLADSTLNKEQGEYVEIIKSASENLLALINNILDLSKIESGQIALESTPVDIRKTITDVVKIVEPRLKNKPVELKLQLDENLPAKIKGDQLRISQILFNLIGNAIKFTDEGFIEISCKKVNGTDNSKHYLSFKVKDTGIGVPKDKQEAIFERFTQANDNTQRLYGGTGLGLNIAKGIVDMHGGTLKMESSPNEGTMFYFIIPFEPCKTVTPAASNTAISSAHPNKNFHLSGNAQLHILLVEDNAINAMLAKQVLENGGFTVLHVSNGLEAVNKVQEEHFDAVLMDIQMPVMNGISATEIIRAMDGAVSTIPIVAMTANSFYGEMQNCYNAGMTGYVSKPFKPENLFAAIMNALSIRQPGKKESYNISDIVTYAL